MEKKLKLKHMAPYLPYGLKCQYIGQDEEEKVYQIIGIEGNWVHLVKASSQVLEDIIPIFLPLSDLNEAIFHNGETIVPFNELRIKHEWIQGNTFDDKVDFDFYIAGLSDIKGYDTIPHWMFQDLIKWHFDVFGLIDSGLAIDINTLKHE